MASVRIHTKFLFLVLGMCFAANHGGPGSPAAGGRNAIMVGYLMANGSPHLLRRMDDVLIA